jgi:hypothetical protein
MTTDPTPTAREALIEDLCADIRGGINAEPYHSLRSDFDRAFDALEQLAALTATEATDPLAARVVEYIEQVDPRDFIVMQRVRNGTRVFWQVYSMVNSDSPRTASEGATLDEAIATARALLPPADGSRVERCGHCGESWPCWQYRVDPVDSHHRPEGGTR